MNEDQAWSATQEARIGTRSSDLADRIAEQDLTIQTIERRLTVAAMPQERFSFSGLVKELSIETELSMAREVRGSLLHDQKLLSAEKEIAHG